MLLELNVEDFALIDKLSLEFGPGLNIITGETGAGKSILLDAVSLLIGARSSREMIRSGCDKARVEGVFQIADVPGAMELCEKSGYEAEDGILILSREINLDGRNRLYVNSRASTVGFFAELGKKLVDLHGQHAHQSLLYPENHLRLLDSFGGKELQEVKAQYIKLYARWQKLKRLLKKIVEEASLRRERRDLIEFQLKELEKAELKEGEREELDAEREKLLNADQLYKLSFESAELLASSSFETDSNEILTPLRTIAENLTKLSQIDQTTGNLLEEAKDALYRLEELSRDLSGYADSVEFNPGRLDQVEARLFLLENLQRKYRLDCVGDLLNLSENLQAELLELKEDDQKKTTLAGEIENVALQLGQEGEGLFKLRQDAFSRLKSGVEAELKDLVIEHATLECSFQRRRDKQGIPAFGEKILPHLGGLEDAEFLFSANIGEEPKPLSKIASGGEISRLMLTFKLVLAGTDKIPTLIFDEIDSGVGGKTGQKVAEKLAGIAKYHQVLCVTHLTQIAAFADKHFYIEKKEEEKRTVTRLTPLGDEERVLELSRMLSGDNSKQSLLHAKEILKNAEDTKDYAKERK